MLSNERESNIYMVFPDDSGKGFWYSSYRHPSACLKVLSFQATYQILLTAEQLQSSYLTSLSLNFLQHKIQILITPSRH